jgi:hypothetical protein
MYLAHPLAGAAEAAPGSLFFMELGNLLVMELGNLLVMELGKPGRDFARPEKFGRDKPPT